MKVDPVKHQHNIELLKSVVENIRKSSHYVGYELSGCGVGFLYHGVASDRPGQVMLTFDINYMEYGIAFIRDDRFIAALEEIQTIQLANQLESDYNPRHVEDEQSTP
jgi:hypothetical protein